MLDALFAASAFVVSVFCQEIRSVSYSVADALENNAMNAAKSAERKRSMGLF